MKDYALVRDLLPLYPDGEVLPGGVGAQGGGSGDVAREEIPLKPVPGPTKPQQVFDLGDSAQRMAAGWRLTLELRHVMTAIPGTTVVSSVGDAGR